MGSQQSQPTTDTATAIPAAPTSTSSNSFADGSPQQQQQDATTTSSSSSPSSSSSVPAETTAAEREKRRYRKFKEAKPKDLSGFRLVEYKCRKKKKAYSRCFNNWYSAGFLNGKNIVRDETCDDLFETWRSCILNGMKRDRERKGLPPPNEGSILSEVYDYPDDDDDNDDTGFAADKK